MRIRMRMRGSLKSMSNCQIVKKGLKSLYLSKSGKTGAKKLWLCCVRNSCLSKKIANFAYGLVCPRERPFPKTTNDT